jgi:hypothetical protein
MAAIQRLVEYSDSDTCDVEVEPPPKLPKSSDTATTDPDIREATEDSPRKRKEIQLKEDYFKGKPLREVWNALGVQVDGLHVDAVVVLTSGDKIPKVYCKKRPSS